MKFQALSLLLPLFLLIACGQPDDEKAWETDLTHTEKATISALISGDRVQVLEDVQSNGDNLGLNSADWQTLHSFCGFTIKRGTYKLEELKATYENAKLDQKYLSADWKTRLVATGPMKLHVNSVGGRIELSRVCAVETQKT